MKTYLFTWKSIYSTFFLAMLVLCNNVSVAAELPDKVLSPDKEIAKEQRAIFDVIARYETGLNTADTSSILSLFTPDSYTEWNDTPTDSTTESRKASYDALFKAVKFNINFIFDSIEVDRNMAFVRTYKAKGATNFNIQSGRAEIDLNRELFVMKKVSGEWRIAVYMFNTNPVQGQG